MAKIKLLFSIRKLFIKLCRKLGFEIIDQAQFRSPTLEKDLASGKIDKKTLKISHFLTH